MSLTGCSLALSGPDPGRAASEVPRCDTGKGLVGIDGVVGGGLALGSLVALGADEPETALISGVFAAAFIGAAMRGNRVANECRAAFAAYTPEPAEPFRAEVAPPAPRSPVVPGPPAPWQIGPEAEGTPAAASAQAPADEPAPPTPAMPVPESSAAPARPARPAPDRPARPPASPAGADAWGEFWREVR